MKNKGVDWLETFVKIDVVTFDESDLIVNSGDVEGAQAALAYIRELEAVRDTDTARIAKLSAEVERLIKAINRLTPHLMESDMDGGTDYERAVLYLLSVVAGGDDA